MNENNNQAIDLVYLWVDGNDPVWSKKKTEFTGGIFSDDSETNCKGRYISNDELKYSLRSIEKNASWINNIYIITDNQKPSWLNVNHPQIHIVDHKEILPSESLPCFNSTILEHYIYRIPNLSEYFIFSNDDTFLYKKTSPSDFFNNKGQAIIRLRRKILGKWQYPLKRFFNKEIGHYRTLLLNSALLVEKITGKFYGSIPHHNIDSFRKSHYQEAVEIVFKKEVEQAKHSHIRTVGDLHRSAFAYYFLAKKYGVVQYVTNKTSARLLPYKHDLFKKIKQYNPTFLCINDDQNSKANQKEIVTDFLEKIYPTKSAYEY